MTSTNESANAVKRAELMIERRKIMADQHRIAGAINNGGFFPRPVGTPDPPRLTALYQQSQNNTDAIKAIDEALAALDDTPTEG